jgi:hypothetical protein
MNTTTQAILQSVASSDPNLSVAEKALIGRLVTGNAEGSMPEASSAPLLMTQRQAAYALGISRVSLWRMTRDSVFQPVEILPGTFRYRRDEIEAVARDGHTASLRRRQRRAAPTSA